MAEAVENGVRDYDFVAGLYPDKPNLTARALAAENIQCLGVLINHARNTDMTHYPSAEKRFVAELEWVRNLLEQDMSEIYRQAKFYESLTDDVSAASIGMRLRWWAVDHKYPPAEFDLALGRGAPDDGPDIRLIKELADRGYTPAILEVAKRALTGDGLEKNKGEAWYWLKRAQQEGVDTSSITQEPLQRMLEELNGKERSVLTSLADFHDDLDLSGIKIPASFLPLSPDIPPPLSDEEIKIFAEQRNRLNHIDGEAYNSFMYGLFERAAGIRSGGNALPGSSPRPFGMSRDEYLKRLCRYHTALDRIFPEAFSMSDNQGAEREMALMSLFQEDTAQFMNTNVAVGKRCPARHLVSLAQSLAWAQEIGQMTPSEMRSVADEFREKAAAINAAARPNNTDEQEEIRLYGGKLNDALAGLIEALAKRKERGD